MSLKQPSRKLRSAIADIIRARVRPDDLCPRVVRKQSFERRNVSVQLPRVGRAVLGRRRDRLRQSFHVQVDGHIVLGCDVGKQQHQRGVCGRVFIILHRRLRQREMLD